MHVVFGFFIELAFSSFYCHCEQIVMLNFEGATAKNNNDDRTVFTKIVYIQYFINNIHILDGFQQIGDVQRCFSTAGLIFDLNNIQIETKIMYQKQYCYFDLIFILVKMAVMTCNEVCFTFSVSANF